MRTLTSAQCLNTTPVEWAQLLTNNVPYCFTADNSDKKQCTCAHYVSHWQFGMLIISYSSIVYYKCSGDFIHPYLR